jgi:UDP-glucuronate decarboxylase
MKVLVTGGVGFLGSHLVDALLARGDEVIVMDNFFTGTRKNIAAALGNYPNKIEVVRHDVCDPYHVDAAVIYNLACPASPLHYQKNPVRTIKTAFLGTLHALECARDVGARLIIASTSEVYGDPLQHPQKETYWGNVNPVGIRSCYDIGKVGGEAMCASWKFQFPEMDVRVARIFNSYGPRMAMGDGRLIPSLVSQAMRQQPLTVYGDGNQTRSFCYAEDTIAGLMSLEEVDRKAFVGMPIVNIGNPEERTIFSVAKDIAAQFPGSKIEHRPLPADDPKQRCPDISRARELLRWEPKVSYSEGLKKTVRWFLSQ